MATKRRLFFGYFLVSSILRNYKYLVVLQPLAFECVVSKHDGQGVFPTPKIDFGTSVAQNKRLGSM